MTLTKRLYRFDEVRAAFLYGIRCHRVEESLFWLRELEESLYGGEAQRLLFVGWFMFIGLRNLTWLLEWCRASGTVQGRQRLCIQLCRLRDHDSSLWWLLVSIPLAESDSRVVEMWRHKCCLDGEEFWQSLMDASTDERIDEILEGLQVDMKLYGLMAKATAVALTTCKLDKSCWTELTTRFDPVAFDGTGNLRKEREYEIPYMCLFGMCWRGRGADTSADLCKLHLGDFQSSALWRKRVPADLTDEATEAFWDTYFPWVNCDHPDEWSLADRKKSHGEGVNCSYGAPLWRWWKNWIPKEHRWFWGLAKDQCWKWVQEQRADVGDTVLHRVFELYKELEMKELEPRKKKVFRLEE